MTKTEPGRHGLVYAPHGRDADIASQLLAEAAVASSVCLDLPTLVEGLTDDASFLVIAIEAVRGVELKPLPDRLAAQPAWSDMPIILLTQRGGGLERNPEAARLSETLGNVSFLERPFHPTTFISVVRAALRSRQRQFEARARIEEVREGEASLSTALLAGRLGSWEMDLSTQMLTTSDVCKRLFGREPDAGFSYDDLIASIHADDRRRMLSGVAHTIATGEDYEIEYRVTAAGQPIKWAAISGRLVRDRDGQPLKMVGVSADITERKAAEIALNDARDLLEDRVAQRTVELEHALSARLAEAEQRERAEALLHQAQKMEMIGQLTGGVAHDFNNLLMVVLGNLELLKKLIPADPRANRLLSGAVEGAQRGATLTQRLLAFARRQELEVKPHDIAALVRGLADLLARSAGARVQIHYDLDPLTPLAAIDANQTELALMNLVVNARDAMPDGGEIRIKVDQVEADRSADAPARAYVRLTVADTGVGMDSATLEKATDPFFSTKAVGKGTGLGLSMIHGLAVQLGGALTLTSAVGVGTTAELLLPATNEPASALPSKQASPAAGPGRPLNILVVDDDPLIAMSTVDMLEDLGHVVVERNSGQDALAYLATATDLDLVITDYAMPQMNGFELIKAVRATNPHLPVLLASGFADLPDGDASGIPRIAKPYSQAQLREIIRSLV